MTENLGEQLKELRALRDSLSWTLSDDATRVRYHNQRQATSLRRSPKTHKKNGNIKNLDFPITAGETKYVVLVTQKRLRQLPPMVYTLAWLVNMSYDVLGLMHLIEVSFDHTFRPPSFKLPVISQPLSYDLIEPS